MTPSPSGAPRCEPSVILGVVIAEGLVRDRRIDAAPRREGVIMI
jgi:hypothetical protein